MTQWNREWLLTGSKVDNEIYEEYCIRKAVEGYPPCAQIVIEETNGDRQDNQIGHQQKKHTQVPIKTVKKIQNYFTLKNKYIDISKHSELPLL